MGIFDNFWAIFGLFIGLFWGYLLGYFRGICGAIYMAIYLACGVGPSNHILDGGPDPLPQGKGHLGGSSAN